AASSISLSSWRQGVSWRWCWRLRWRRGVGFGFCVTDRGSPVQHGQPIAGNVESLLFHGEQPPGASATWGGGGTRASKLPSLGFSPSKYFRAALGRGTRGENSRRRRIEVEERLRSADREPGELDEGPVGVERGPLNPRVRCHAAACVSQHRPGDAERRPPAR